MRGLRLGGLKRPEFFCQRVGLRPGRRRREPADRRTRRQRPKWQQVTLSHLLPPALPRLLAVALFQSVLTACPQQPSRRPVRAVRFAGTILQLPQFFRGHRRS